MPYKSRKQAAYLHIHHPEIARKWDMESRSRSWTPGNRPTKPGPMGPQTPEDEEDLKKKLKPSFSEGNRARLKLRAGALRNELENRKERPVELRNRNWKATKPGPGIPSGETPSPIKRPSPVAIPENEKRREAVMRRLKKRKRIKLNGNQG